MAKKQASKRGSRSNDKGDIEENVDKIRDILFGTQMRDYEQRLDAMEQRLAQGIDRATRSLERRVERLDAFARREVDKLSEQIKTERKDRSADVKKGTGDLKKFADQFESWFAEVDEQLATESKDLRESLHEQTGELSAQIGETHDQLQETLHKKIAELADAKLAREDVASLFSEIALRLNKDFKLPKG